MRRWAAPASRAAWRISSARSTAPFIAALSIPTGSTSINENNRPVYFSPYDGKIHEGVLYTDTGFWDTFRAAHPLYNLLFPEISAEILQGLLNAYDQSGWLPSWASPGHRDCMIGNHAFSLLADGWAKGIRIVRRAEGRGRHDA